MLRVVRIPEPTQWKICSENFTHFRLKERKQLSCVTVVVEAELRPSPNTWKSFVQFRSLALIKFVLKIFRGRLSVSCLSLMKCYFKNEYKRFWIYWALFKLVELLDLNVVQSFFENEIEQRNYPRRRCFNSIKRNQVTTSPTSGPYLIG